MNRLAAALLVTCVAATATAEPSAGATPVVAPAPAAAEPAQTGTAEVAAPAQPEPPAPPTPVAPAPAQPAATPSASAPPPADDTASTSTESQFVESPEPQPESGWQNDLAVYFLLAGVDGTNTIKGQTVSLDAEFRDIVDVFGGAAMLFYRGQSGRTGLQSDFIWVRVVQGVTNDRVVIDAELNEIIYGLEGFYEVGSDVEVLFGLRTVWLHGQLGIEGPLGRPVEGSDSRTWIDPIVGLQWRPELAKDLRLFTRLDVGAGMSDLTWQAAVMLSYRAAQSVSLTGGYRVIGIDYDDADGGDNDVFAMDIRMSGPVLGAVFHF